MLGTHEPQALPLVLSRVMVSLALGTVCSTTFALYAQYFV